MDIIQTIIKVFGAALGISLLIKYGISGMTIPGDDLFVLSLVLLPTIATIGWLGYQAGGSKPDSD